MQTTKIFKSGNSLAVRLPKAFTKNFTDDEVEILEKGDDIIIRKLRKDMSIIKELLKDFPKDIFPDDREDDVPQKRDF